MGHSLNYTKYDELVFVYSIDSQYSCEIFPFTKINKQCKLNRQKKLGRSCGSAVHPPSSEKMPLIRETSGH